MVYKSKFNIIARPFLKVKVIAFLQKVKVLKMDFTLSYALFNHSRSIVKGRKGRLHSLIPLHLFIFYRKCFLAISSHFNTKHNISIVIYCNRDQVYIILRIDLLWQFYPNYLTKFCLFTRLWIMMVSKQILELVQWFIM